jgi:TonB family protein
MNTATEQRINVKATAWTVGVHALLLLLFAWMSYSIPSSAPIEELGMEVNLGTSDDGSGTDQPMAVDAPSSIAVAATPRSSSQQNMQSRDMMTSDDPDAPAVAPVNPNTSATRNNNQATNTRRQNNQQTNNTPTTRPQQPRYVYQGSTGPGGNNAATNQPGTSEGNTTGNGDRGVPGGTPGASNYTGSPGNGTGGIKHTLSGRDIFPRQFVAEFNEGGKVVIKVTVDRDGNIIDKRIKSSPNRTLSNIALQKLSQAKFSPDKDAGPQQFGEITIVFKSRS